VPKIHPALWKPFPADGCFCCGGQSGPAILEVNHNKQLVWYSVSDFNKSVESIQILDNPTGTLIPASKERSFETDHVMVQLWK
jgi:hypothetical protein